MLEQVANASAKHSYKDTNARPGAAEEGCIAEGSKP